MIRLIIDIFMYRITPFKSFFLFLNVNDKSLIYNIVMTLYMDVLVVRSMGIVTLYIGFMYLVRKLIKWNYNKFIYFYLYNMIGIMGFFLLFSNYKYLLNVFAINSILVIISYKFRNKDIKLL